MTRTKARASCLWGGGSCRRSSGWGHARSVGIGWSDAFQPAKLVGVEAPRAMRLATCVSPSVGRLILAENRAALPFDKWRLLSFRRVRMRLGYEGKVMSPHNGWLSNSHVTDFSEEQNSFTPADPETDPWGRFVKRLKEQRTRRLTRPDRGR